MQWFFPVFTLILIVVLLMLARRNMDKRFLREIKKMKEALLRSEYRHRLITENVSDVIWIYNVNRQCMTYVSPSVTRFSGYTVEEALAQPIEESLTPESAKKVQGDIEYHVKAFLQDPSSDQYRITEVQQNCKDGGIIWVEASTRLRFNEDREIEIIGVSRNVEKRKRLQQMKEDVDRILYHDIRSPLSGIISLPYLLEEDENLTAPQKEILQTIRQLGTDILEMANISLALSKQEHGTYEFHPVQVQLVNLLEKTWRNVANLLQTSADRLIVTADGSPANSSHDIRVLGEELLLRSVWTNLLTNAVEASPHDSPITVHIHTHQQNDGSLVCVSIHNLGIVPERIRSKFFEKYITTGKSRGTGLGAYSAKLMIETMGGSITMKSPDRDGTSVEFSLPAASREDPKGPQKTS